jgi:hypothetical protein
MKMYCHVFLLMVALNSGCQERPPATVSSPPADHEAEIKASLANLNAEDRELAVKQKYCPVMPEVRLGEMGTPYKIDVKGQPVFVCCKNCERQARADPDKVLASLRGLKGGSMPN